MASLIKPRLLGGPRIELLPEGPRRSENTPREKAVEKSGRWMQPDCPNVDFIELMARSNFSFLQGASSPEELVEQSIRLGYQGLGLCDLNGLYGVARGFQAFQSPSHFVASVHASEKFRYLVGSEIILSDETSLVLMPMSKRGYSHLCHLLTLAKRQSQKGFIRLTLEQIRERNEELLAFALPPWTADRYLQLAEIFSDRLYLPVWRDLTWESRQFNQMAFHLERTHNAQLFVTNRPFMHASERKPLFDVLTCIYHQKKLTEAKQILIQNGERYLRPLEELRDIWSDRLDLLSQTLNIAQRVNFSLKEIRYKYPQSQLPPGKTSSEYLSDLVDRGLQWRYPQGPPQKVVATAKHELGIIKDLGYEDYFLTLYEICEFAKEQKILYQGRGSAANSVVCFSLGLTSVDPNKIGLLFERFISKERAEPPDIDIDFEHSRREEVIQHIYKKYGEAHAAMVCNVIRYRSRMALREVAKVLGVDLNTVNRMVKFMGRDGVRRLIETPDCHKIFQIPEHTWRLLIILTRDLHGFPRHLGIHSGGFVISHEPIMDLVPVEKASMEGRYVVQWNKDDVNFLQLMKIDFLSLGMLTALRKCLSLLKDHKSIDWNLATIPAEDPKTYEMICQAETIGVFQIESRAQMNTLPRLRPKTFYDLVIEVALVRPGPLQGGMVHPYLKRRQAQEEGKPLNEKDYPHPDLIPILERTHGVPIFQEQVMQIVVVGAGFSPGEADELRRVMSNAWRKKGTMDGIRDRIMTGLHKKGITAHYAEQVYKTIEGFANYGFPESHAASFALLTYASSYIKCHHPDVFACALLNSQPMGFYPPRVLIFDAQKNGVSVRPLCVQKSSYDYTLEPSGKNLLDLRVGLRSIYGISSLLLQNIEAERHQRGPFQDLKDFIQRTRMPKPALIKMAASGAFASFESSARKLIFTIEALCLDSKSFLWGQTRESFSETESPQLPAESAWSQMQREYDSKGFSIDLHPMSVLRPLIQEKNKLWLLRKEIPATTSREALALKRNQKVRVLGLAGVIQRPPTAKGFCFITLEDEFGFLNIIVPPDIYQKDRMTIYSSSLMEIVGTLEIAGALRNIRAESLQPLNINDPSLSNEDPSTFLKGADTPFSYT